MTRLCGELSHLQRGSVLAFTIGFMTPSQPFGVHSRFHDPLSPEMVREAPERLRIRAEKNEEREAARASGVAPAPLCSVSALTIGFMTTSAAI